MKAEILGLGVGYESMSSPHFCIMPQATLEITSPHLCIMASEALEMYREPLMNIKSTGQHFVIDFEMPGVAKDSIKISLAGRLLEVEAKAKASARSGDFTYRETASKLFYKGFELPEDCDGDKIVSNYVEGILEIKIPRRSTVKKFSVGQS